MGAGECHARMAGEDGDGGRHAGSRALLKCAVPVFAALFAVTTKKPSMSR